MIQHRFVLFLVLAAACTVSNCCVASHPYHASNAEVAWNPKTGNFEIALCVWPADLERALAKQENKPIDLDTVKNLDQLISRYVETRFVIRKSMDKQDARSAKAAANSPATNKIRWVGHEKNLKTAWLYFEIPGDKKPAQWKIENRVFFELNSDQLNQLRLDKPGSSLELSCVTGKSQHSFSTAAKITSTDRPD